jgi:hypothetical protein
MKNAFTVLPEDISRLRSQAGQELLTDSIVCSRISEVAKLEEAANVYFVISKLALFSTAYQDVVLTALKQTRNSKQWVLFLDEVPIPLGFEPLRSLPRLPLDASSSRRVNRIPDK